MVRNSIALIAVVLLVSVAPATVATQETATGQVGSSVTFDAEGDALVDYAVDGETMAESVRVQSQSEVESGLSLGASADVAAVVGIEGSPLSLVGEADGGATVQADSGATLETSEDAHGSLVVATGGEPQYVEFGLSDSATVQREDEGRVVVETENGATATALVVGDGDVTVNDGGNVTASLDGDDRLVFRSYTEARTDADREQEDLIASGTATASVDLSEDASEIVSYDGDTLVEMTSQSQGTAEMAVERSSHEGTVLLTSFADGGVESAEDLQVTVDGEAAAAASSTAELREAAAGGDSSMYLVRQRSGASASTEVLVAVNHFSTRDVAISEADDGDGAQTDSGSDSSGGDSSGDDGDEGTTSGGIGPGFGALGALVALALAAIAGLGLARRRP